MNWTSVKTKPAPFNKDLLITLSTGRVVVGMCHTGFGWDWADTDAEEDVDAEVTHWMQFPAPAGSDADLASAPSVPDEAKDAPYAWIVDGNGPEMFTRSERTAEALRNIGFLVEPVQLMCRP